MSRARVEFDDTKFDNATYKVSFCTNDGLKSVVHVKENDEGEGIDVGLFPQGNRLYGVIAFYLCADGLYDEPVSIRNVFSMKEWVESDLYL